MNKTQVISLVAVTVIGLGALGATRVLAEDSTPGQGPMGSLVQKIAQKFNLNQADVQSVFDEQRAEHQAQMQAAMEARLSQAVTDGNITEDQKQLILQKHEQMKLQREADMQMMRDLTPEERREKMQSRRNEMQQWAEENGIEMQDFMFAGRGHGGGRGQRWE